MLKILQKSQILTFWKFEKFLSDFDERNVFFTRYRKKLAKTCENLHPLGIKQKQEIIVCVNNVRINLFKKDFLLIQPLPRLILNERESGCYRSSVICKRFVIPSSIFQRSDVWRFLRRNHFEMLEFRASSTIHRVKETRRNDENFDKLNNSHLRIYITNHAILSIVANSINTGSRIRCAIQASKLANIDGNSERIELGWRGLEAKRYELKGINEERGKTCYSV